jgi:hypothetical protein
MNGTRNPIFHKEGEMPFYYLQKKSSILSLSELIPLTKTDEIVD